MNDKTSSETFDLICKIARNAEKNCKEPIPDIIRAALEEIGSLAQYKGIHGNLIASDRLKLFDLE
jgi:hypothetical protein